MSVRTPLFGIGGKHVTLHKKHKDGVEIAHKEQATMAKKRKARKKRSR